MQEDRSETRGEKCSICGGALDSRGTCLVCGRDDGTRLMKLMKLIKAPGEPGEHDLDFNVMPEPGNKDIESIIRWLSGGGEGDVTFVDVEETHLEVAADDATRQPAGIAVSDSPPGAAASASQVADLKIRLVEANSTIEKLRLELRAMESMASVSTPSDMADRLAVSLKEQVEREQALMEKNRQIEDLKSELRVKQDSQNELMEKLSFKEEEFNNREISLQHREALMREELMKVELNKAQLGSVKEIELKKSLEDLREQIKMKEEKVKSLEKYLSQKEEELDRREKALIGKEVERVEELTKAELRQEKVRTGTPRLDDLLLGGIRAGAQVVVYGPPFVGKEVVMNTFAAEGLRKGVPVIWVTTDHTIREIREEMSYVLNSFEEYEKLGLIYYIDAYSRSVGDKSSYENTAYVEDFSDIERIDSMVEERLDNVRDIVDKKSYRIIFRSISSLTAVYETRNIFKLMRPFVAKRKRDKCTAMYCVEKGIVSDQDVQIIGSVMDGVIEFETDGQSNFISIKGIGETQTRDKVKYTSSKSGLSIGSFSLGHIK